MNNGTMRSDPSPATNQLINAITRKYGISENQLVISKAGSSHNGGGTWMHRLIKATIGIGSAEEGTGEAVYYRRNKTRCSFQRMFYKFVCQYSHRRSCGTYHPKRI